LTLSMAGTPDKFHQLIEPKSSQECTWDDYLIAQDNLRYPERNL
jgi:hypothetical protein